jgi:hypothetical protein
MRVSVPEPSTAGKIEFSDHNLAKVMQWLCQQPANFDQVRPPVCQSCHLSDGFDGSDRRWRDSRKKAALGSWCAAHPSSMVIHNL